MRTECGVRMGAFLSALTILGTAACGAAQASPLGARLELGEMPPGIRADHAVFVANCGKCHDLERALSAPVLEHRHWQLYVARMMKTSSSGISSDEAPRILSFLYWFTDQKALRGGLGTPKTQPEAVPPALDEEGSAPTLDAQINGESTR